MIRPKTRKRDTAASLGVYDGERNILDLYLHEVSRTPLLTPAQEIEVARRAQQGDRAAMEELATRNLRFVISVAKKYQNRGLPLVDLIGEGNLGLLTAVGKFDPGHEPTAEEIGESIGLGVELVQSLAALKRLRQGNVGRALASFAA